MQSERALIRPALELMAQKGPLLYFRRKLHDGGGESAAPYRHFREPATNC